MHFVVTRAVGTHVVGTDKVDGQKKKYRGIKRREDGGAGRERVCLCQGMRRDEVTGDG